MTPDMPLVLYAGSNTDEALSIHQLFANHPLRTELVSVKDGEQVLAFLRRCEPERLPALIILDVHMPKLDGRDTLGRLRCLPGFQTVPVLLLITSSFDLPPLFTKRHGARFMTKPLRDYQLTALLQMLAADVEPA